MRDSHIRDLIPSSLPQRICLQAEIIQIEVLVFPMGNCCCCPHAAAYPKRAHGGFFVEQLLSYAARSVVATTDAADMPRFVPSIFDAMRVFVDEEGVTSYSWLGVMLMNRGSLQRLNCLLVFVSTRYPQTFYKNHVFLAS